MTIKEIFDSMAYGPAPESATDALAWIARHNGTFGHFIDGVFTRPGETFTTANPDTGNPLAEITQGTTEDVEAAVQVHRSSLFVPVGRAGAGNKKPPVGTRGRRVGGLRRASK